MTPLIKKVFSGIIVCFGLTLALNVWLFNPDPVVAYGLVAFEGHPTEIVYNCLCSGSIMVTVEPTQATQQKGAQTVKLLYVWAADLLSNFIDFGMFAGVIPHAYLWCGVAWTGDHELLGNYVPGGFPCYEFVGPPDYCRFKENANGAFLNVGSSLWSQQ